MANRGVIGCWRMYPDILGDLKEGDIIEFDRSGSLLNIMHFGVYIGRQGSAHYIIHKVGNSDMLSSSSPRSWSAWSNASKQDRERCTSPNKIKGVRKDLSEVICSNRKCRINNQIDNNQFVNGPYSSETIVDRCIEKLNDCSYDWVAVELSKIFFLRLQSKKIYFFKQ